MTDSKSSDNYTEEDFDALLIENVKNYPCLYKTKPPSDKTKETEISNAWHQVSVDVGETSMSGNFIFILLFILFHKHL